MRLLFQLVGTLLLTAWVLKLLLILVIIVAVLAVGWGLYKIAQAFHGECAARRAERELVAARADEQHRCVRVGDSRGINDEYPPALALFGCR